MALRSGCSCFAAALLALAPTAHADTAAFDLSGPRVEVKVTRGGKTLPISQVANLEPGDWLWLRPDVPDSESAHYLLIVAFLQGPTNPPPEDWFTRIETWDKQVRQNGVTITVPKGAQQALLFLAPATGGDFKTLRSAVRGKPGAFVRVSQDLNQASLDRTRLDAYLKAIQQTADTDPAALHERTALLARSLRIKVDAGCFDKPPEQQAACLTHNIAQLVLDDGHSESMVAALTSGSASDLIGQLSSTRQAGGGYYSPYIGAFMDVIRIMDKIHTAEYQYIPALGLPRQSYLELKLNSAPSFHKPKSVLVAGLPAVGPAPAPPLRPIDARQIYCLQKFSLVLPVDGAPLVFSTDLGHNFELHLQGKTGRGVNLPARPDAELGGFTIDTRALQPDDLDPDATGALRGNWGFEHYDGPSFHLRSSQPASWTIPLADKSALIVGRAGVMHLQSGAAACVDKLTVKDQNGKPLKSSWKLSKPDEIEAQIPLKDAAPGPLTVFVKQSGLSDPDEVPLRAYAEPGTLDRFAVSAGDKHGVLRGTRLVEVSSVELNGVRFVPETLSRAGKKDELRLSAPSPVAAEPVENDLVAQVALKDGRVLDVKTTVDPPKPKVALIGRNIQPSQDAPQPAIRLTNREELPQDARLSFFLKSPTVFSRAWKIEVGAMDASFHTYLSIADGSLTLQDSKTALAVLDPLKSFGPSAFGPLRFRPVDPDGAAGDWQPLAQLVRLPPLKEVRCPDNPDKPCALSGTNLFLIDSVSSDQQFAHSTSVPEAFAGSVLSVPRPSGTLLYIKLRDDPSVVNVAVLPVLPE